jgi:DNA-binding MarR family transcriptional regulator
MRKVMRAVTQYYDRYLEQSGIRSTQFTLLVALASTSAKTLTEIAESLVMDRTTLTRNLKPLANMELIATVQTVDKRSKAYILTDKGKALVQTCVPLWQEAQNSVIKGIGSENYHEIVVRLEKLLSTLTLRK